MTHPLLVHLPIALLIVWPLVDAAGLLLRRPDVSHTALALLLLALPASLAATVSGQSAYDAAIAAGVAPKLLDTHTDLADAIPWLVLALSIARFLAPRKAGLPGHWATVALGLLLSAAIVQVGKTGGELVYEHAVGVNRP